MLYDLQGDADSVYSPDFFAIGSRWRAHVYECGKEGEPLCLAVKLNRLDNYEGAVQAQVCFWAVCVEGCSYFSQSMEMVGGPRLRVIAHKVIQRVWDERCSRWGSSCLLTSEELSNLRSRDAAILVGATVSYPT